MASESMKMNMKGNMHSHVLTEFNSEVKFNFIVARSSKGPLQVFLASQVIWYIWNGNPEIGMLC